MEKIVEINEELCTACGRCVKMCPTQILYIEDGTCKVSDESKCDRARGCEYVCPTNALKIN